MSNLSREDNNMVISSEESSSPYPDESELELGLGLSVGGSGKNKYAARIFTAKDFDFDFSPSSSSSCSSVTRANNNSSINGSCGMKRTAAEPSSPPARSGSGSGSGLSQVVGWPPVKNCRINSFMNNAKSSGTEEFASNVDASKTKNIGVDNTNYSNNRNCNVAKKASLFVKVNMDGIPIGRKVDLNAHNCYETLAHALDDMFRPSASVGTKGRNVEEQIILAGVRRPVRLLDGLSDFVLTYEDKEGDLMLVGDVPWEMFLSSVRRLRIMKAAEANGLSKVP